MADPLWPPGTELEVEVGAPAHGGSCVARHEGRVVFVRHALPGERVVARITDDRGAAFCFADAVTVLTPAAGRVEPPCPHAGPGRCGGCDWQHASGCVQRELKATVVRDQFARLARLDVDVVVEELPGGLLGWRTRNLYAVDADGRAGLRRHRSHEVEPVERCPLGTDGVGNAAALRERWPGCTGVEVVAGDATLSVLTHRPGPGRQARGRRPPDRTAVVDGPPTIAHVVGGRTFRVGAGGFWQVHPAAAQAFAAALLDLLEPRPGESVLDLYAGAGALSAPLADAVGTTGRVVAVESSADACADASANLADLPQTTVLRARVTAVTVAEQGGVDLVVLDPPRAGAGREVVQAVLAAGPRAVGYVACDPAALARDVRTFLDAGWRLGGLRAFDAFPMTHHVECVALLEPPR